MTHITRLPAPSADAISPDRPMWSGRSFVEVDMDNTVPVASVEFSEFVESFKHDLPEQWEAIRGLPTEQGLELMVEVLRG